jgi:hypothetical protein
MTCCVRRPEVRRPPSQAEDPPHGLGLEGIDFQGLLGAVAAPIAGYDAVTDRRQRAIPEALLEAPSAPPFTGPTRPSTEAAPANS